MSAEQLLIIAVASLASCVVALFIWTKTRLEAQYDECILREKICDDKHEKLLTELAQMERRKKS
jgi:hypothetical protein